MDKPTKKRVLVTASTFPTFTAGDATPAFIYELTKRLTDHFDITVLVPYSAGCKPVEIREGMEIIRFKYWFGKKLLADGAILPNIRLNKFYLLQLPFFFLCQTIAISKICRAKNISLIHAHWIIPQGLTAAIYKQLFNKSIKLLASSHGSDVFGLKGSFFSKIRKFVLSKCNKITVVGPEIKRQIQQTSDVVPCSVIPMGLDIAKFRTDLPNEISTTKLLFVGRLAPEKRVLDLVKAVTLSNDENITLTIVGEGPEQTTVQKYIATYGADNIVMKGSIPHAEIPLLMQQHDIFVLPSEREGMPVSLVEAMATGMICIGSDIVQVTDVITHNVNGFVFNMGDPQSLANTIKHVISCNNLESIRNQSITTSQAYDWNKIAGEFKEIIHELT